MVVVNILLTVSVFDRTLSSPNFYCEESYKRKLISIKKWLKSTDYKKMAILWSPLERLKVYYSFSQIIFGEKNNTWAFLFAFLSAAFTIFSYSSSSLGWYINLKKDINYMHLQYYTLESTSNTPRKEIE